MRNGMQFRLFIGLSISILLLIQHLPAQYFGRNKVQYEHFDFRVLRTEHFSIYYYASEEEAARDAARMAERWYARLSRIFNHQFDIRRPIILYADHPDFQQTNVITGLISEGTGGVTEALKTRVVLPFTGSYKETDHVLGHELVHAFQYDMAQERGLRGIYSMAQLPLWSIEGLAEYLSVGREDDHTAMWLRDAVLFNDVPTLKQLARDPRYFPYRYGQAVWAFIGGQWGDTLVTRLFRVASNQGMEASIQDMLHMDSDSLSQLWTDLVKKTYHPLIQDRTRPEDIGKKILAKDIDAGNVNLGPVLSPDGKYVAFFSEKDIFSIDLFLADAHTGKFIKKLASADRDPHFDALSFMNSAGTWSPDGKKFAFVVFADGDNQLVIMDVHSGKIERRLDFKNIGAISNPAWSPNGQYIVFSGMAGGLSDLYLFDLMNGETRQLTHDRYADYQPAWAPDGKTIAFATDRGLATDFENLTYSSMQIGLLNLKTGSIQTLNIVEGAKHINPQFSSDGTQLYFVSDPDGFSDVYRYDLLSGEVFRLTRVATGISGLTYLSPALTVARKTGYQLFSVFEKRNYNVYAFSQPNPEGTLWKLSETSSSVAGILPPTEAVQTSLVVRYLNDYQTGLPINTDFPVEKYHPSLKLDYIGQPVIGIAVDRFGTALGGAISAYFSDMLGYHVLGMALQANGGIKDLGGQLFYQNRAYRWNWGGAVAHIPYLSTQTGVAQVLVDVGGTTYLGTLVQQLRDRVFLDVVQGIAEYPFSVTRRLETSVGFTRISYDREIETEISVGGQVIERRTESLPAPPAINLFQSYIAYVGDNAYFGFTSPTRGRRFRFEVEPTVGTLRFVSGLADYRRYIFKRPMTIAFRILHYGRYGRDSNSERLAPLFLGYETFVRGYSSGSFDLAECSAEPKNPEACPEFDRLIGSRIAVTNLEFRVPLFGNENFGLINFPFLPTELSVFLDGGLAWSGGQKVKLEFRRRTTERVPVFSTGVSMRVNLLGYLIMETYLAYPFQRPDKGWHFGFQIAQGW